MLHNLGVRSSSSLIYIEIQAILLNLICEHPQMICDLELNSNSQFYALSEGISNFEAVINYT